MPNVQPVYLNPAQTKKKRICFLNVVYKKKKKKNSNFRWKGFSVDKALQLQGISNS